MSRQSTDERAYRRLIRRHTARREWLMVHALFFGLGELLQAEETTRIFRANAEIADREPDLFDTPEEIA